MWSRTQALVSLSSAEAELYAAIKACKPLTRESAEHLSELVGMEFPEGHDEIAFTINFHRSVKTSHITFNTCIAAESWAEWHLLHLAENESQVQMFPDISKKWSIVERC